MPTCVAFHSLPSCSCKHASGQVSCNQFLGSGWTNKGQPPRPRPSQRGTNVARTRGGGARSLYPRSVRTSSTTRLQPPSVSLVRASASSQTKLPISLLTSRNHSQSFGTEEAKALEPSAAMEGAFQLNMGIAQCLNRKLRYGDKSPEVDFFEAAVKGNLDRLRGKLLANQSSSSQVPSPSCKASQLAASGNPQSASHSSFLARVSGFTLLMLARSRAAACTCYIAALFFGDVIVIPCFPFVVGAAPSREFWRPCTKYYDK